MAGGDKKIHEHPNANSNGFDKRPQDAIKGGRKPSIRTQLEEVINEDGTYTVDAKDIVKTNEDGSVVIQSATAKQMAVKLVSWAMSKRGTDSIKAIQMIMDHIDGKPTQPIEQKNTYEFEGDPFARIRENAGVSPLEE